MRPRRRLEGAGHKRKLINRLHSLLQVTAVLGLRCSLTSDPVMPLPQLRAVLEGSLRNTHTPLQSCNRPLNPMAIRGQRYVEIVAHGVPETACDCTEEVVLYGIVMEWVPRKCQQSLKN